MKDYDKKKKSYYLFRNINELDKNNNFIIEEINNIIKTDEFNDLINNSINIMNKMDIKYKGKNISLISSNVTNVNNGNKSIDNYFSDINMVENLPNIQILYENFIKIYNNNNNPHNSNDNYEKLIDLAMLAEQIENYEDMLFFVKEVIKNKKGLMDSDERNLFSRACKNYISSNRKGNRIIEDYEDKERKKGHSDYLSYIIEYKNIKETISFIKYHNVIKFIEDNIIKKDNFRNYDDEAKTFFYKKLGDFHRYLCEIDKFKSKYINIADKYYKSPIPNPQIE